MGHPIFSEISIEEYLKSEPLLPMIDVRAPGEFEKGHIPDANNIPVFSDHERAIVGTIYKQRSNEEAIKLGHELVNPKLNQFIKISKEIAPRLKVAVHCWRGGMRSRAFATHLISGGFKKVYVINGGYKTFRNHVLKFFNQDFRLNIIGGFTGSGKTQILKILKTAGEQVIDLEYLANHKGSVFGGIGNMRQPTVEQFENNLFWQWKDMDLSKPVWLEDESFNIGPVKIPLSLFRKMNEAPLYFLEIPKEERARYLVSEYAACNKKILASALQKLNKRLGGLNTRKAVEFLYSGNYYEAAMLALTYYDKSYRKALSGKDSGQVFHIRLNDSNHQVNASLVMNFIKSKKHS
ncbi:MAG: tRNA 2-selenouridine(34) synthase MnmH [Bacteroidia bacterium]|nr:tRNA 2-selenouridine(34) synthase MnmH [Bacteroidia bacterium]